VQYFTGRFQKINFIVSGVGQLKVFYQTEWHGIHFASFARISAVKVAGAGFYNAFFQALFARFKSYEELDGYWRKVKEDIAEWLVKDLIVGKNNVHWMWNWVYGTVFVGKVWQQA